MERAVGLAIHNREAGTEGMKCPPAWRESFAAGDELREKYDAVPDEILAEYYARRERIEEGADEQELERWAVRYEEWLGIPRELVERAVGPDVEAITEEERQRRITEYLADLVFGEKGYRVVRHMERIEGLEGPTGGRVVADAGLRRYKAKRR